MLAAIVATSYRQTIRAYPNGGGAYVVAKENLGAAREPARRLGLIRRLRPDRRRLDGRRRGGDHLGASRSCTTASVEMAVGFVALLTLGNLRGIRESGTIFAIPTYFFIFTFGGMLVVGLVRARARP